MSKLQINGKYKSFHCPGCNETHTIDDRWGWNGSLSAPTFTPSIKEESGHYAKPGDCWCTYNVEHPDEPVGFTCHICHSYVTDGKIQFLNDCTHPLKDQIVELPEWPA